MKLKIKIWQSHRDKRWAWIVEDNQGYTRAACKKEGHGTVRSAAIAAAKACQALLKDQ